MFSYEFCEISKNTFLTEDVLATASIFNGYFIYTFTFTTFIWHFTAQNMKLFIMDLFGKCEQICRKPRIRSHLLKKSLWENFIFCGVFIYLYSVRMFSGKCTSEKNCMQPAISVTLDYIPDVSLEGLRHFINIFFFFETSLVG